MFYLFASRSVFHKIIPSNFFVLVHDLLKQLIDDLSPILGAVEYPGGLVVIQLKD